MPFKCFLCASFNCCYAHPCCFYFARENMLISLKGLFSVLIFLDLHIHQFPVHTVRVCGIFMSSIDEKERINFIICSSFLCVYVFEDNKQKKKFVSNGKRALILNNVYFEVVLIFFALLFFNIQASCVGDIYVIYQQILIVICEMLSFYYFLCSSFRISF